MENSPYRKIIKLLKESGVDYKLIYHEPVYTSEQAEKITGLDLGQGMKSLLVKGDRKFVLAVIPGDKRLDVRKMALLMKVKRVGLATKEEVKERMHCELGSCYPLGGVVSLRTIADPSLLGKNTLLLSPGVNDKTIIMSAEDYFRVAGPERHKIIM